MADRNAATYDRHHAGPDIDEDVPEHAAKRIDDLRSLGRRLYAAARLRGLEDDHPLAIEAAAALDMDPPGFDPATEGP